MPLQQTNLKILIVEPNPLLQVGLSTILKENYPNAVISVADTVQTANSIICKDTVDLVILESDIDNYDGFNLIQKINIEQRHCKVLCYSNANLKLASSLAHQLGAKGFIDKSASANEIISAINCLLAGFFLFKSDNETDIMKLSRREKMVFLYLSKGLTNKQISTKLFLSEKTVSTYKVRLLKKLNCSSLMNLMPYQENLISS